MFDWLLLAEWLLLEKEGMSWASLPMAATCPSCTPSKTQTSP
jgi:hypothetical protein